MDKKFKVGDKAYKPKGYAFPCTIVGVFETLKGEIRVVGEMDEYGLLHIFNEGQLEHVNPITSIKNMNIETTPGLQYDDIQDVTYLRDRLFAALKVPKAFMGYEKDLTGKATLNEKYNQIIDEAYKSYRKEINQRLENWIDIQKDDIYEGTSLHDYTRKWTKEEFINKCKTDSEFSKKWGLKIEERGLTTVKERQKYDKYYDDLIGEYPEHHETLDKRGVPRRIITITYNNETIEIYE